MKKKFLIVLLGIGSTLSVHAQSPSACSDLTRLKLPGVEIRKATTVTEGTRIQPHPGMPVPAEALPAHCRVDGVINRRKGVDGEEFGIGFALALPAKWNGDFVMQGGGGSNGFVGEPLGATAAGDTPALMRGFAVLSNDTGHSSKNGGFDFNFMRDQQAMLDFAFEANAKAASIAKEIIASYYNKPAAYSYFAGCSTGGREGMILSQRFPTIFNGIISGDPAMRTSLSNLAINQWAGVTYNRIAPKDANGTPQMDKALNEADRKIVMDALIQQCDGQDGVVDGMISNPLACKFDPRTLICKDGESKGCLSASKAEAIQTVFSGPKDSHGVQIYPGYLYDTGINATGFVHGLLVPGHGPVGTPFAATEFDFDNAELSFPDPLVEPRLTSLSTFSGNGGKLIFFHGDSDPWFSPLDTLQYYQSLATANGGAEKVALWSQIYLVPGMNHCGGGPALDQFDLLTPLVNWVEKGTAPVSVNATGRAFPGRSRPLCPYPLHAQYKGQGNTEDAANFECRQ